MKRVTLAGLLGAITIFIWQMISYTVLPWHMMVISNIPNGEQVVAQLKNENLPAGLYHFPGYPEDHQANEQSMQTLTEKMRNGPNIHFMVYNPGGFDPFSPAVFIRNFIFMFLAAGIAAYVLLISNANFPKYWKRVITVVLLGSFFLLVGPISDWNWWHFPVNYTTLMVVDGLLTWFFAGLVIAWRMSPQ